MGMRAQEVVRWAARFLEISMIGPSPRHLRQVRLELHGSRYQAVRQVLSLKRTVPVFTWMTSQVLTSCLLWKTFFLTQDGRATSIPQSGGQHLPVQAVRRSSGG